MNASLTLACLIAAGVGLVVQNTLMVRITQSASTILIAMLLNSLVGIVILLPFCCCATVRRAFRAGAQHKMVDAHSGLLGSFCLRQHQWLSERWRRHHHRGADCQPAGGD
ncbi:hypothetical protein DMB90_10155 [Raoultella planticola]|uniref:Inner membrane protein ydcZ n=1 Tax=Raoultella planticola TaxID=575 RepID=A0A5P6A9N3_RAOPL|nr:hypothetical protein DMB90_10155 [Raoultella planticola]